MIVEIEQPHGYLRDADGRVVNRFGDWTIGEHRVLEVVDSVEYIDGPNAHEEPKADQYRSEP